MSYPPTPRGAPGRRPLRSTWSPPSASPPWLHFGGGQRGRVFGFAQAVPRGARPDRDSRGWLSIDVSRRRRGRAGPDHRDAGHLGDRRRDRRRQGGDGRRLRPICGRSIATLEQELDLDRREACSASSRCSARSSSRRSPRPRCSTARCPGSSSSSRTGRRSLDDLTKLDLQHATVAALASEKPRTLGLLSRADQGGGAAPAGRLRERTSAAAAKLDADVRVARQNIELLEQRRAGYALRAANAGASPPSTSSPATWPRPAMPLVQLVSARGRAWSPASPSASPSASPTGTPPGSASAASAATPLPGTIVARGPARLRAARCAAGRRRTCPCGAAWSPSRWTRRWRSSPARPSTSCSTRAAAPPPPSAAAEPTATAPKPVAAPQGRRGRARPP